MTHSLGGPGSITTRTGPSSTTHPSAVPQSFGPPRSLGEICLLEVVVGGSPAALGKVFADIRERVLIEIELPVKGAQRLLGEIVARGAETAGRDDEIGAVPRAVKALGEPGGVVADDGVPVYVHAQLRQRERNVPRVGVQTVPPSR